MHQAIGVTQGTQEDCHFENENRLLKEVFPLSSISLAKGENFIFVKFPLIYGVGRDLIGKKKGKLNTLPKVGTWNRDNHNF